MQRPEGFPNHMVNYINCADVDAAAQRVENNGGTPQRQFTVLSSQRHPSSNRALHEPLRKM